MNSGNCLELGMKSNKIRYGTDCTEADLRGVFRNPHFHNCLAQPNPSTAQGVNRQTILLKSQTRHMFWGFALTVYPMEQTKLLQWQIAIGFCERNETNGYHKIPKIGPSENKPHKSQTEISFRYISPPKYKSVAWIVRVSQPSQAGVLVFKAVLLSILTHFET